MQCIRLRVCGPSGQLCFGLGWPELSRGDDSGPPSLHGQRHITRSAPFSAIGLSLCLPALKVCGASEQLRVGLSWPEIFWGDESGPASLNVQRHTTRSALLSIGSTLGFVRFFNFGLILSSVNGLTHSQSHMTMSARPVCCCFNSSQCIFKWFNCFVCMVNARSAFFRPSFCIFHLISFSFVMLVWSFFGCSIEYMVNAMALGQHAWFAARAIPVVSKYYPALTFDGQNKCNWACYNKFLLWWIQWQWFDLSCDRSQNQSNLWTNTKLRRGLQQQQHPDPGLGFDVQSPTWMQPIFQRCLLLCALLFVVAQSLDFDLMCRFRLGCGQCSCSGSFLHGLQHYRLSLQCQAAHHCWELVWVSFLIHAQFCQRTSTIMFLIIYKLACNSWTPHVLHKGVHSWFPYTSSTVCLQPSATYLQT